jgi:HD-GYP domain-containing protein (c-di-GMP phosphodiesterase class II)
MSDVPARTRISALALAVTALVVVGGRIMVHGLRWSQHDLSVAVLLAFMIVLVEKFQVDFPHSSFDLSASVGAILSLAAALTFDPAQAAVVVAAAAIIDDLWDRLKPIQIIVNGSNLGLSAFAGCVVYRYLADTDFQPLHSPRNIGATIVAASVYTLFNTWVLAIIVAPVVGQSTWRFWRSNIGLTYVFVSFAAMGSLVPLLAAQHPLALLVLLVPLIGSHLTQRALLKVQQEAQATIESLVDALEVRDDYTHNHSVRVAQYVQRILDQMPHLPQATRKVILDSARIHDIGKMGVRDNALLKPGRLSDEEFEEIKRHPVIGAELIGNLEMYRRSVPLVRHHHERWDGRGYPDGIAGEEIPLGARIITVADSFDAMTSNRPYRDAMTFEAAMAEIVKNSGVQFDPQIVEAFERATRSRVAQEAVRRTDGCAQSRQGEDESPTATMPAVPAA